ncbi:uncharacterized protein LOC111115101 [Crassostrea virginica]
MMICQTTVFVLIGSWICFIVKSETPTGLKFKVSAIHNQTYVTISCEHPSARLSNTGIFIQDQNRLAECRWIGSQPSCNKGAIALPYGVQVTTKYNSLLKLKCGMDSLLVDVKITELIPSQSSKSEYTATGVNNQTHVVVICDHRFLKMPETTVYLKEENNYLAECKIAGNKTKCTHGAQILKTGIQFIIKYSPSMKLKCGTDELLIDVVITKQNTSELATPSPLSNGGIGQGSLMNAWNFIVTLVLTFSFLHGGLFKV